MADYAIQQAQERVQRNLYDYDGHLNLISLLSGQPSLLLLARENMAQVFPLDLALWTAWIDSESDLGSKINLHHRALADYQCINFWLIFGRC